MISNKFLAALAVGCALAVAPIALAAGGATATATPKTVKQNKSVELRVSGLKPGEKMKAVEAAPFGQKRTLYPSQKASTTGGVIIVNVKAQIKGRHTWTFTGRQSHRKAKTFYIVR